MLPVVVRQMDNDVSLVIVRGEIDVDSFPTLDAALEQVQANGPTSVLLDLWEVTFLDSIGLGLLLAAKRRASRFRRGLALVVQPQGVVAHLLETASLGNALPVFATRDMGRTALRKPART
jgi:anti-sigma B factor antagonist